MNPPSTAHVPICGPFHFHLAHKSNGGYGTIISILIGAKKLHEEKMWGIRIVGTLFSVGEGWEAYKEWTGARDRGEGALTLGTFWRPVQSKARRPKTLQMQASPISTKPFQDDSRFKDCQPEDGPILAIHSISWFSLSSLTTRVDALRYKAWEDTENKGGSLQTNGWVDEMIVNGREEFISSRHSGIYRSGRNLICWQVHCQIDRKVDMPNIVKLVTCMVVLVWTFVIQTSIQTHCRTLLQVRSIFLPWSNGWITYCADIIWALGYVPTFTISFQALALECIDELTRLFDTKAKEITVAVGSSGMVIWGVSSASAYRHWCQVRLTIVSPGCSSTLPLSKAFELMLGLQESETLSPGIAFGIARHSVVDMIGSLPPRRPLLRILNRCSNIPRRISKIQYSNHYTINHTSGFSDTVHWKVVSIWQNWDKHKPFNRYGYSHSHDCIIIVRWQPAYLYLLKTKVLKWMSDHINRETKTYHFQVQIWH